MSVLTEVRRLPLFALRWAIFAVLCLIAYWPFLGLPPIGDDYIQIHLGRIYGPFEQWGQLAQDALYRCRTTSILITHWTETVLGAGTHQLNISGLLLHFINTVLVFLTGYWDRIGWRVSFPMACFFAVYQRPQEAVIWYAALPELLVFTFVMAALLFWRLYLQREDTRWYAATLACYLLAMLSKESAVVFAPLALALAWMERRRLLIAAPFFVLALAYFAAAHASRDQHLHFNDGTFSLGAPFLLTALRSIGRLLWVWGGIAAVILLLCRRRFEIPWLAGAAAWMFIALMPYSFLTYQGAVPSRHTYLASVGIAFLVGRAFCALRERFPPRNYALACLAFVCLSYQVAYLWFYKYPQYVERAEPTESLLQAVGGHRGPVKVTCFRYGIEVAQRALEITTEGEAWLQPVHAESSAALLHFDNCPDKQP